MKAIRSLEKEVNKLDFWKAPTRVNRPVDVMVPPEKIIEIERFLSDNQITSTTLVSDVQRLYLKVSSEINSLLGDLTGRQDDSFFRNYRSLEEIHAFIDRLATKNPDITEIHSVGRSGLGRDLKAIKIGKKTNSSKPMIFIDGTMHAREWISTTTVTYIAYKLIEDYSKNTDVRFVVDVFDWYILPVSNPDGYEYTRLVDRFWRKSLRVTRESNATCKGVNLNRNWSFHWREGGSSPDPCSCLYAGPEAFSEPETKSISDFILARKDTLATYLSFHSYGQQWLTPWGWTTERPTDYESLVSLARVAVNALTSVHGVKYQIGTGASFGYIGTGASDDFVYGVAKAKYAYTVELRDVGVYGLLIPPNQIIPTGEETFAGVTALAKALEKRLSTS